MKPSIADFRAYEYNFEPAGQSILKNAGQPVWSPFIVPDQSGNLDLKSVPDDVCFLSYEPDETTDDILAFRESSRYEGGLAVDAAGFGGTLVVTRRVPFDDQPPKPGEAPGCYLKLCKELGIIREAFLDSERPFAAFLPMYDVLSIKEARPNRQIDGPRSANQHTLRFPVRFMPSEGAW